MESGASIDVTIAEFRPDVLVLDIGKPGEDGYALIRRIRTATVPAGGQAAVADGGARAQDVLLGSTVSLP